MSNSISLRRELQDHGSPTRGQIFHCRRIHNPVCMTLTKCHIPVARTGTGTGCLAERDLMQVQMTHILWYKHPPTCRKQDWSSSKQHKVTCIQQWKGSFGTLSDHPLVGQELYTQDAFCWWYSDIWQWMITPNIWGEVELDIWCISSFGQ